MRFGLFYELQMARPWGPEGPVAEEVWESRVLLSMDERTRSLKTWKPGVERSAWSARSIPRRRSSIMRKPKSYG